MNKFWEIPKQYYNNLLLIDPANNAEFSYREVKEMSDLIAGKIRGKKNLAFLFCKNDYLSVVYYLALLRSGNAVLLLDNKLNEEISAKLTEIYKPEIIFRENESVTGYEKKEIDKTFSYHYAENSDAPAVNPETAVLLSTSGTTGSPKLVRLSYKNVQANADSIVEYLEIKHDQRSITSLPMSYSFGLSIINTYIMSGASLLLTDKSFVFRDFWNLFDRYKCTSFSGVPYSYELLKKTNFEGMDLSSLKVMTQAGGRLSTDLIKYFSDLAVARNFRFYVMYGQTEATARISYVPYKKLPEKIGSIGISIPGGSMNIYSESEKINEPNVQGELVYEGNNVMLGYAEERVDLAREDDLKGKLFTGDLALKDGDGFFYITGRMKRFIKLFGLRLNLDEVEKMIESHYQIFNACSGTDDKLFILIDKGDPDTAEDIRQKVSLYYKINKSVITVRLIDKMPVTESGKKDYKAISKLF